jgi:hypothetical protein
MDDIINLYTKQHGYYKRLFQFNTLILFLAFIIIFSKIFNWKILILVIIALYFTNYYVKINNNDIQDNNKMLYFKYQVLQEITYKYIDYKIKIVGENLNKQKNLLYIKNRLDSLYIDSNLIEFLFSIHQLQKYNPNEFYLLLKGVNNILKIKKDIEEYNVSNGDYPENISELLESVLVLKTNCLNNFQNFIYSVPKTTIMYKYLDNSINTLNVLLTKNINDIHKYQQLYNKIHGTNTQTKFIYTHGPKHFDVANNKSVNALDNKLKLIDLYV